MKRPLASTLLLLTLSACGPPRSDPSYEIINASGGVGGKVVTLKDESSFKGASLTDAAQDWLANGWTKVASQRCKGLGLLQDQSVEAYEMIIEGYAPDKIPTRTLRLCAAQLSAPKRIAALGYIVSSAPAKPFKP